MAKSVYQIAMKLQKDLRGLNPEHRDAHKLIVNALKEFGNLKIAEVVSICERSKTSVNTSIQATDSAMQSWARGYNGACNNIMELTEAILKEDIR